jgi:hypothetical protein
MPNTQIFEIVGFKKYFAKSLRGTSKIKVKNVNKKRTVTVRS